MTGHQIGQQGGTQYVEAMLQGFQYLMREHDEVFCIGQGLWSPWYVGNSMRDLDKEFGRERVIDSPVAEQACTGAAIGAALCGYRPIVIHPRMDFMTLAVDQIVNQAAKWNYMLGGANSPSVTIRGIINRGGQQGAQHSQALHSWFAHVPGLQIVMPATAADARDLLIGAVLSPSPTLYLDDRWLYETTEELPPVAPVDLADVKPRILRPGRDVTLVGASYSAHLGLLAAERLVQCGVQAEVVDLRMVAPLDHSVVAESVARTGRLVAIDGSWSSCGLAAEIIAGAVERVPPSGWRASPRRVTLPDAPAPTSASLEYAYYPKAQTVVEAVMNMIVPEAQGHA